jgi:transcriptional regulator with GAF, ATPase, and Fis domain
VATQEEKLTLDQSGDQSTRREDTRAEPGLIKVFAHGAACFEPVPLCDHTLVLGRGDECSLRLDDGKSSRRHAEVSFRGGRWLVRDLGSRNGTLLDGQRLADSSAADDGAVLAIGGTVFLLARDVGGLRDQTVEVDGGVVVGPRLRPAWQAIRRLAAESEMLHITGETGTGKEMAARLFHTGSGRAQRPFVAVNCATIPPLLAERLLFGARRGAYSGADTDSDGYLVAADGGTLFLDEVAELPPEVQSKVLRAIESREVVPLGAAKPRKVDIAICTATHVDLRALVGEQRFRQDLYFRIARPAVTLPPLRTRAEEIPWIIEQALGRLSPPRSAHVSLIVTALGRPWPGNVRELIQEVTAAARAPDLDGDRVESRHLAESAGQPFAVAAAAVTARPATSPSPTPIGRDDVVAALQRESGNVSGAARALGVHRTQLRRWLERFAIDPRDYGGSADRE